MQKRLTLRVWHVAAFISSIAVAAYAQQPGGLIAPGMQFPSTVACPTGWTENTTLRGRSPVGLVASGTNATGVGTALTDQENRAVGLHSHITGEASHTHTITEPNGGTGHRHSGAVTNLSQTNTFDLGSFNFVANNNRNSSSATTGVTINNASSGITLSNAGTVAGTNLPYVQLFFCRKS